VICDILQERVSAGNSYGKWCVCLLASDTCSLNSFLRVASVHVCPFIPPEAIIHKTVAEANSVLRLWHNHICGLFEQFAKWEVFFWFLHNARYSKSFVRAGFKWLVELRPASSESITESLSAVEHSAILCIGNVVFGSILTLLGVPKRFLEVCHRSKFDRGRIFRRQDSCLFSEH
jgi:hypothetical protein